MGLLSGLLTLPVAPVRGVVWVAERMLDEANTELSDPATIHLTARFMRIARECFNSDRL